MFIFIEMPNLYKLKEAMIWIHDVIKDEDSFEELCKILGEAIGIAGYKLQLLAYYDVEVVFANELAQAPDRAVS